MKRYLVTLALLTPSVAYSQVHVRVIDVGAGLCCVVTLPDADGDDKPEYAIIDAGFGSNKTINKIKELIPTDEDIELLVLSHSDRDHIDAVENICIEYNVKTVLRTGFDPETDVWVRANQAIIDEEGCTDISLSVYDYQRGSTFRIGEAFIQFVAGWNKSPASFGVGTNSNDSEFRNAISIVVKLIYKGKSVLFAGDTIGREIDAEDDDPLEKRFKAAEREMVQWNDVIPLKSHVIIAPHHGGDNGSSVPFINLVDADFVVFSSGNTNGHPRKEVAERYTTQGVLVANMFRTDRGSDAGGKEWPEENPDPNGDKRGDDDVDIILPKDRDADVAVSYRP